MVEKASLGFLKPPGSWWGTFQVPKFIFSSGDRTILLKNEVMMVDYLAVCNLLRVGPLIFLHNILGVPALLDAMCG